MCFQADGIYLFVNRVDENDIVRVARASNVAGHTLLTQDVDGSVRSGYDPVNVCYAGDIKFENGNLIKWANGKGITNQML